jgi:peroxiredoxin
MVVAAVLAGCGDNLLPSGEDKRPPVQAGTVGSAVGQQAPAFSTADITGTAVTLADALGGRQGVVLYFTMWCPICDSHMNNMRAYVAPNFPQVGFYLVDYVSGSVADAAAAAAANGFGGGSIAVLTDVSRQLTTNFQGTMGTTIVIDGTGIVRMNEDYRDGTRLQAVLASLP